MANDYESFVDRNRAELVQRVSSVMPLADVLLSQGMLKDEPYSEIYAERTSQAKMRALFRFLKSRDQKETFYNALKKNEPYLVEELEHGNEGITEASHGTQESSSGARHGEEDRVEVEIALEKRWNKISQRWQAKLQDLLKEQKLQKGEKLLLRTAASYEIGAGCNGTTVYIGMKADGTEVAIKRMVKSCNKELQNEMSLLRAPELESCYIVKYVDFVEDKDFYYLALQLCEYTLEEYMERRKKRKKEEEDKWKALRELAKEVLLGLKVLHDNGVLHRDIKPQNVLIDVKENTRLADFGFSRRLNSASTTITRRAGTQGWEAAEILDDENENEGNVEYKKSSDMQVAGMLVHYILSEGHHPFGTGRRRIEQNIIDGKAKLHRIILQDVEAKDLIEEMIHKDPKKRLTIGEAIDHPYFWDDARRDSFLRNLGDEEPMHKYWESKELHKAVREAGISVSGWKIKMPEDSKKKDMSDDFLGLLRYMRNVLVHRKSYFYENNMFRHTFPDFFINAKKLAKQMDWKF